MQIHIILVLSAVACLSSAQACSKSHLIVARGSFEAKGEGTSKKLSSKIKQMLPGTTSEALDYPAVIPYKNSMARGSANLKKAIINYSTKCPSSKIGLIGYSQGGAVIVDALCGGGGHPDVGPKTPGMTKEQAKNVKAAVSFGDPRFVPGMPYNLGTNNRTKGVVPRDPKVGLCPEFASIVRSWCDNDDARCASGKSLAVHGQYLNKYDTVAANFIIDRIQ